MSLSLFWQADGTFKSCPSLFKQLVTILCVFEGQLLNCAYLFLQDKTTESYTDALGELVKIASNEGFTLRPSHVLMDFERALHASFVVWNHHQTNARRTNNDLEGYHSSLNYSFPKAHPNLAALITHLK